VRMEELRVDEEKVAEILTQVRYMYNQCCGFGMFIPDPGPEFFPSLFRIRIEEFLTRKIVSKLSEISSGLVIPDPDPDFLPIPDPEVKKAPDPGF
jgi:hypothetical protein